jgi:hypothetical protein
VHGHEMDDIPLRPPRLSNLQEVPLAIEPIFALVHDHVGRLNRLITEASVLRGMPCAFAAVRWEE